MRSSVRESSARGAGAVVGGLGVVLASVHAIHAAEEFGTNLPAVFYGSVIPFLVAISVLTVGLWIERCEWRHVSPWRLVGWCGAGALVTLLLALLHIQYQLAEGVVPEHRGFVSLMFVTYGSAIGLVVGVYDVRIQEARAKLAEKTRRLDEFASIVSHDLRNPLNVAQGYVDLTRKTGDVSELDIVLDAHDRMDAILADMLALAQSGEQTVTPTAVNLDAVAEEAWAMVATGDATLTVTGDVTFYADRDRLKTLFENLFRNSVEHGSTDSEGHGPSGSRPPADDSQTQSGDSVEHGSTTPRSDTRGDGEVPISTVSRAGDDPAGGDASGHATDSTSESSATGPAPVDVTVGCLDDESGFYVEDTGPGIPPEIRERVFEAAFTTGAGSGLGLSIVRAAADAHGWSHTLTESGAGGARFEFRNVTFVDD
ncbi:sensor histidine kinase [Haloplanus aerogenes]|uniref:histidine kinase n=1 Tax=Haloplanus aerogenes TaxID=660522 RepID=A0A3M0DDV3_9EURY|nr:HAMP domain-containing sensor histidine kinase [Haloplanus aerogenes]AZH26119.1 sensor histidine kinase [Haloplanus aerogenes]RMB18430.1 signal transduction histidine kinase [Haloplanus aerogenes]